MARDLFSSLRLRSTIVGLSCLFAACGGGAAAPSGAQPSSGAEQPAAGESEAAGEAEAPAEPFAGDPVKVSPDVYKVVLDGPRMRVVDAVWKPGQRDNLHGHPPLVAYAFTEVFGLANEADETQISIRIRKDQALIQDTVKAHAFENRGKSDAKLILFERKPGQAVEPMPKGGAEAQVASPKNYELVAFDTTIHVLRATWKPGESDELHGHPAATLYALTDVDGEMADEAGKTTPFHMKAGSARFEEPVKAHSFKNTGASDAQLLIVEQKD